MPMSRLPAAVGLALTLASHSASASCQVSLNSVNFGSVSPTARTDSTGQIRVHCDQAVAYLMGISPGPSGGQRRMTGPSNATLRYDLYADSGHNFPWGDGHALGDALGGVSDGNKTDTYTIYGAIPAQPGALPGQYVDTPLVTLSF
jgi:spore coat protein U-like protein